MAKKRQTNGLRELIISTMTRQQKINFILRKDNSFCDDCFENKTDEQIRLIAISVDKQVQAVRLKRNPLSSNKLH